MPAQKARPPTFSEAYYTVSREKLSEIGDALAQQAGPPASVAVTKATDPIRVRAWDQKHPEATDEAMLRVAVQQYQKHRAAGLPDEDARRATAEDLTHFRYRARLPLYTQGTTSWHEQVKEAERLSRLAARKSGAPSDTGAVPTTTVPASAVPAALPTEPAEPAEEGMSDEY
jgi:hypothetical protein